MATDRVQAELVVRLSDEAEDEDYALVTANEPLPVKQMSPDPIAYQFDNGQLTASTTAQRLAQRRNTRRRLVIKNTDSSITVYIGKMGVSSTLGMSLLAGESISVMSTASVWVVAASGSPVVAWWDEFD